MSYLIVGGTAGLGRALAESSAEAGHDLVLVASGERDLAAAAADLRIRYGVRVATVAADIGAGDAYLDDVATALQGVSALEGLMFPVGAILPGDDGTLGATESQWLIRVNFSAVANAVSRFLPELLRARHGMIVGFGSIATYRGRGTHVVYSAAKRALESYFGSIRYRYEGPRLHIQFYVLGYLDTVRGFGQSRLPKGNPSRLSREVLRNADRAGGTLFFPAWWRYITLLLNCVPWPIFKRLRF